MSDQHTQKKMQMLYGKRASCHILSKNFNFALPMGANDFIMECCDRHAQISGSDTEVEVPFMDRLVIPHDSMFKSRLDGFIMVLVLYSCITSLYNSAFTPLSVKYFSFYVLDWAVEFFFYLDVILTFFHAYHDEDAQVIVSN